MPAKRKWTTEQLESIAADFHSDLTNKQVGSKYGCDYNRSIKKMWMEWYGEKALHDRYRKSCALSKLGDSNPMKGKYRDKHPRYVESYLDSNGYRMSDTPVWWEGSSKACKYLEHIIVGCTKYRLTKPLRGYVFHHIDEDKLNNHPDNIDMMTAAEHMAHHKNATRKCND